MIAGIVLLMSCPIKADPSRQSEPSNPKTSLSKELPSLNLMGILSSLSIEFQTSGITLQLKEYQE